MKSRKFKIAVLCAILNANAISAGACDVENKSLEEGATLKWANPVPMGKSGKLKFAGDSEVNLVPEDQSLIQSHCFLHRPTSDQFKDKEISFPKDVIFKVTADRHFRGRLYSGEYYTISTNPIVDGKVMEPTDFQMDCPASLLEMFDEKQTALKNLDPNLCLVKSASTQAASPEIANQSQNKNGSQANDIRRGGSTARPPVGMAQ